MDQEEISKILSQAESYMGYPMMNESSLGMLGLDDLLFDDTDRKEGLVPRMRDPLYLRQGFTRTAGFTPVTLGRVTTPPFEGYYLVEWYQGGDHPITLVPETDYVASTSLY